MKESQSQTNLGSAAAGWHAAPAAETEQPFVWQLLRAQGERMAMAVMWLCLIKVNYNTASGLRTALRRAHIVLACCGGPAAPEPLALAPGVRFTVIHVVSPSSPFSPQGDARL